MRLAPRLSDDRRFSWQVDLRLVIFAFMVLLGILAAVATTAAPRTMPTPAAPPSVYSRSRTPPPASGVVRRTVVRSNLFQSVSRSRHQERHGAADVHPQCSQRQRRAFRS